MIFQENSKIIMIGDSITDCGRTRPVAERLESLGNGYVNIAAGHLNSAYPELKLHILNMGISADAVRDLKARWQTDVIDQKPTWVTIMIGINDVLRQFSRPFMNETHIYIDEYAKTLDELIKVTLPLVEGIILISPYYLEPNRNDDVRRTMDSYRSEMKRVASEYGLIYVDVQEEFDKVLEYRHSTWISSDRVHPNIIGHTIIAKAFLKGIGYEW